MKINTISDNTSLFTNYHHVVLLIEGNSIILWEKMKLTHSYVGVVKISQPSLLVFKLTI